MAEGPKRKAAKLAGKIGFTLKGDPSTGYSLELTFLHLGVKVSGHGGSVALAVSSFIGAFDELAKQGKHAVSEISVQNLERALERRRALTHCKHGHPLPPRMRGQSQRRCLPCQADAQRRYRERRAQRLLESSQPHVPKRPTESLRVQTFAV